MAKRNRKNTGLAPGSLVFTGKRKTETPSVSLIQFNEEELHQLYQENSIPKGKEGEQLVSWYDLRGLHKTNLIEELGQRFKIHPLTMEDILDMAQRPKFEEYKQSLYVAVKALDFRPDTFELVTEQITFFANDRVVISFQENDEDSFANVRKRLLNDGSKIRSRKTDYLLYALIDAIVDEYYIILDQIEEMMDTMEEEILSDTERDTKSKIHKLKLATLTIRRTILPLREAVSHFSRSEHYIIQQETRPFLRDLQDHTSQVMEALEGFRDMIQSLYDLFVSEINFKMNNVIQVLTIVTSIFIPLGFLTGLYGMNFEYMPELGWRYSYFVLWGVMLVISGSLLYYFKHKKWI
jgi:magnesium transporter